MFQVSHEKELIIKKVKEIERFSIKARGKSFKYAFEGIEIFFRSQHNAFLHLLATIIVILMAIVFNVSKIEMAILLLAAGFVWTAELFNTAIEKIMDFISKERHPEIKFIKDISAAAVLISAIVALITGAIIFIPKL